MIQKNIENSVYILKRYCSFQERTIQDVRKHGVKIGVNASHLKQILEILISERYIDEQRYATEFVYGKLKNNKWGRIKLRNELKSKQIPNGDIDFALSTINEQEYLTILEKILLSKFQTLKTEKDMLKMQKKLFNYALSKGFESELILKISKKILKTDFLYET